MRGIPTLADVSITAAPTTGGKTRQEVIPREIWYIIIQRSILECK